MLVEINIVALVKERKTRNFRSDDKKLAGVRLGVGFVWLASLGGWSLSYVRYIIGLFYFFSRRRFEDSILGCPFEITYFLTCVWNCVTLSNGHHAHQVEV